MSGCIDVDGVEVLFEAGMTVMQACKAAGIYVPHLCWNADFAPHGSCRICCVKIDGREMAACNTPARDGMRVENNTEEIEEIRKTLLRMLFVEGNHTCPGCEKSGSCQLQAVAYYHGVLAPSLTHFYPLRKIDASHDEVLIDFNRCILCELCVRASRETDGKNVFGITGRGMGAHLTINSKSGKLADSDIAIHDRAVSVCPVGAILKKHDGYTHPIGERFYDVNPVDIAGDITDARDDD